jgi:glutathione synthase/RimK-type ligase-like ATP-grasp enzyme
LARLAILYEHPSWFEPVFAGLRARGIAFDQWKAEALLIDPDQADLPDLVLNRMSTSAAFRGHAHAQFAVRDVLAWLESRRVAVVNGSAAYDLDISKLRQQVLICRLGLRGPRTRAVNNPALVSAAAEGLTFPVMVKPNCGGAGSAVRRFDSPGQLAAAAGELDFGCDHTLLVQEFIPARDGAVYRLEVLDGRLLYAVRITRDGSGYNLCPADACSSEARPVFEKANPPEDAVTAALAIARAGKLDLCGVEYILDHRTGEPVYYDINALSNFVAGAPKIVGFDPYAELAEYLSRRLTSLARLV